MQIHEVKKELCKEISNLNKFSGTMENIEKPSSRQLKELFHKLAKSIPNQSISNQVLKESKENYMN